MGNPTVYFDEAGNTGQDLMNVDQPMFVLASTRIDPQAAQDVIDALSVKAYAEIKFSKLKKSSAGRSALLKLYNSELLNLDNVKAVVYHKRFMITTEIVDLLVEPLAKVGGIDLYEQGANIGLANVWHTTLPVFCGVDLFNEFQANFVTMVRTGTDAARDAFYDTIRQMYHACSYEPAKADLGMLTATQLIVEQMLESIENTAIDPAIPSFVHLCEAWGESIGLFNAVHDDSLPVQQQQELLRLLMSDDEPEIVIGYDRRKSIFPLRARGLDFSASELQPEIQIADLIASGLAHWLKGVANHNADRFQQDLGSTRLQEVISAAIWPSTDVTPQELGTEEVGGINAVDYTAEFIARKQKDVKR